MVAGIVYDKSDGTIMRARRREELRSGGLWEFPGGKVEPGETLAAALERELLEELSMRVAVGGTLCVSETKAHNGTIELTCMWAELSDERPLHSEDHDVIEWLLPTDLPSHDWCEPDVLAVSMLLDGTRPN